MPQSGSQPVQIRMSIPPRPDAEKCKRTGHTPVASTMPWMCGIEKLETPIALTLPVLMSGIIAFQVSTRLVSTSSLTQPGLLGSSGSRFAAPNGIGGNATGQCTTAPQTRISISQ